MVESGFQRKLITKLKQMFPGCIVFKTDPNYIQGFPDLMILYRDRWAALECKRARTAARQANQDYYIEYLNGLSFASFIYPEVEGDVLDALCRSFEA